MNIQNAFAGNHFFSFFFKQGLSGYSWKKYAEEKWEEILPVSNSLDKGSL